MEQAGSSEGKESMKSTATVLLILALTSVHAAGMPVDYKIGGKDYQGYYVSASKDAPQYWNSPARVPI